MACTRHIHPHRFLLELLFDFFLGLRSRSPPDQALDQSARKFFLYVLASPTHVIGHLAGPVRDGWADAALHSSRRHLSCRSRSPRRACRGGVLVGQRRRPAPGTCGPGQELSDVIATAAGQGHRERDPPPSVKAMLAARPRGRPNWVRFRARRAALTGRSRSPPAASSFADRSFVSSITRFRLPRSWGRCSRRGSVGLHQNRRMLSIGTIAPRAGRRSTRRRITVPSIAGRVPSWAVQAERWVSLGWSRSQARAAAAP